MRIGVIETMVVALLKFPRPICCRGEVLGSRTPITVAGLSSILVMPFLPAWDRAVDDPLHMPLRPPCDEWFRVSHDWGTVISYPDGCTVVRQACVEFREGAEVVKNQTADAIHALSVWARRLGDYAALLASDYGTGAEVGEDEKDPAQIRLYVRDGGEVRSIARQRDPIITVYTAGFDTQGLTLKGFSNAAQLASLNAEPKLQYRMLLQAFRAMDERDWRSAIIEGACAVEASLAERIRTELRAAERDQDLIKDFRGLTRLISIARVLGIVLPDVDVKTDIIQLRNAVVHKGSFPQRSDALKLLRASEKVVRKVTPEMSDAPM